jgi:hypothetical protein
MYGWLAGTAGREFATKVYWIQRRGLPGKRHRRYDEGVVMRKKLLTSTLMGALIVLALILAVATAGCGTAAQASTQTSVQAQAAPTDAQGILKQALSSKGEVSAATGDFNASVAVTADAAKVPAAQALLGQPITVSGTYSFNKDPKAAEASLTAAIAGQSIPIGLKTVNGQAWIQFMGQWYQMPADMMKKVADKTATSEQKPDPAAIMQALTTAGVDPNTWLTDLRLVGEDTINGTPTYHLAASVNVNQIVSDAMKMAQSGALKGMMPGGAAEQGTATTGQATSPSITMPSQQELQAMASKLPAMFQNLTLDMWIAKDSYQFRQVQVKATIVPPAGGLQTESTAAQGTATTPSAINPLLAGLAQGIKSISVDATVSLTPSATPVTVTPPADAKPLSDLQQSLTGLMGLFSGVLGGGILGTGTTGQ